MAPPFVNTVEAPTVIKMVRDYNVIISDKNAVKDAQILDYLNKHAFPRIRGRLLAARTQSSTEKGNMLFYEDITKLADPATAAAADQLVFRVMTDPIIKDYVWRMGAALAAAWAINMLVGQLDNQQKLANELEKQAMADLMDLVRSPELSSAVAEVKAKEAAAKTDDLPRIYMALDVDPATYVPAATTARTYAGAQETGFARLWLGAFNVEVPVRVGDTPNLIMNLLLDQLRTVMRTPSAGFSYNMVLGPNEGALVTGSRYVDYRPNPLSPSVRTLASVDASLSWMDFHAYQHELLVDGLFCTLELVKSDGITLGIDGLIYGVSTKPGVQPGYSDLTSEGPYSAFIDMAQGKGVSATPTSTRQQEIDLSDTFYFNIPNATTVLTADGVVRYQVQNLIASPTTPVVTPRTVNVKAGMTALDIVTAIARDIEKYGVQYKLLSAVRGPTKIATIGTPRIAPGLRLVPYRPDRVENKIVFDMLEVPPELEFGVVTRALSGSGGASTFDNQAKSLVLEPKFIISSSASAANNTPTVGGPTGARLVQPILSKRLSDAFFDITMTNRMGGNF